MKREVYNHLIQWKLLPHRKPLIMYGARQVGKTYILKDNSTQEVDFVVQANSRILPIEVKAEDNVKSKSLHAFICKDFTSYHLKGVRFSMLGFQSQEWMENIPLYAIESYVKKELDNI